MVYYTTDEQLTSLDLNTHAGEKYCVGAIGMPSGSMWPYKMVTGLLGAELDVECTSTRDKGYRKGQQNPAPNAFSEQSSFPYQLDNQQHQYHHQSQGYGRD